MVLMDLQYGHWTCATNRTFVASPPSHGRKIKKTNYKEVKKATGTMKLRKFPPCHAVTKVRLVWM